MGLYGGVRARNHGWGKRLTYAGHQAIKARYGGHYATQARHNEHWRAWCGWCDRHGFRDARDIDADAVRAFGAEMVDAGFATATIQNRLSSINTTLSYMRDGDTSAWISPSAVAGPRDGVRDEAPVSLDRDTYETAHSDLLEAGHERSAAVFALARGFGLRAEEASKADLDRWQAEAEAYGQINVQEGTKGGRDADRWVEVTEAGQAALAEALEARPEGSSNLLAPGETYEEWKDGELRAGREVLHGYGITGYHDARAAYACERYEAETGYEAPCVSGEREADKDDDREARETIAYELGHGRIDVTASYVGSAR